MDTDYELPPSSPADMSMMELSDSDEPIMTCDRCYCSLDYEDEWWHCDICSGGDYDICQRCSEKKLRCNDDSHDLIKWKNNVDLGNGITGPQSTDMKLPGIPNPWAVVEDINPTAHDGWGCVDDSMAGVWGDLDSSTNWDGLGPTSTPPDPPGPEPTSPSSDHLDLIYEVLLPPRTSASDTAPTTKREHSAMSDNPTTTTAPAAPTATGQHFPTIRAARTYLNSTVARWTPPSAPSDTSTRPTTPSAEFAYVHAAIHSITVGLKHTPLSKRMRRAAQLGDTKRARLLEARAWLLFDALKRLHDGGCVLRPDMDFSNDFGGELEDRMLGFRARWVAVCKMLQKFSSAAETVAWGSAEDEEILEAYVAAPLAMGKKMEEDEKLANEGSEWTKPKLPPTLKRHPPSSDEQEAREEKKRKLNLESLPLEDVIEIMRDEKMKDRKAREAREDREAFFDLLLKNYV
ncbi:putative zinc finger zz-type protein [Lasiodiplodia theobromae]|nr:putative zinc finger zz-type protein [Lasiodiplodia theobromae]